VCVPSANKCRDQDVSLFRPFFFICSECFLITSFCQSQCKGNCNELCKIHNFYIHNSYTQNNNAN
jgi:hypothetical protein